MGIDLGLIWKQMKKTMIDVEILKFKCKVSRHA